MKFAGITVTGLLKVAMAARMAAQQTANPYGNNPLYANNADWTRSALQGITRGWFW